jgi:hypothetical protein
MNPTAIGGRAAFGEDLSGNARERFFRREKFSARRARIPLEKRKSALSCSAREGSGRKASVSRWNMRDKIFKAVAAGATALSLAATAEPAAAQWRDGQDGGQGWLGPGALWGAPEAARDSAPSSWSGNDPWSDSWSGNDPWSGDDSCWQVRPIYSISGAWLNNRRVNVC